jgi:hypothetical protein
MCTSEPQMSTAWTQGASLLRDRLLSPPLCHACSIIYSGPPTAPRELGRRSDRVGVEGQSLRRAGHGAARAGLSSQAGTWQCSRHYRQHTRPHGHPGGGSLTAQQHGQQAAGADGIPRSQQGRRPSVHPSWAQQQPLGSGTGIQVGLEGEEPRKRKVAQMPLLLPFLSPTPSSLHTETHSHTYVPLASSPMEQGQVCSCCCVWPDPGSGNSALEPHVRPDLNRGWNDVLWRPSGEAAPCFREKVSSHYTKDIHKIGGR